MIKVTGLLLVSVFITFVTEKTARAVCRNMWRWASEEPVAKLNTLFPYPKDQFLHRIKDERKASGDGKDVSGEKVEDPQAHKPDDATTEKEQEPERRTARLQKKARDFDHETSPPLPARPTSDPDLTPSWTAAPPSEAASEPTLTSDDFLDGLPGLVLPDYCSEFDVDEQDSEDGFQH